MYENIISTILKSPEERRNHELETIIPWLKKKSPLFQSTKKDIVLDIVKNCEFRQVRRDAMITQQGKKGDCFYVLLRGTVSIYINASMADEEDESKIAQRVHHEHLIDTDGDLDRDELGNLIRRMDQGSCFGEVALISKNCIRSASVVADETVDLLVVDRILYNRCLKAAQVADIEAKTAFVKEHPYFCSWPPKVKKQLAYSLTKLRVEYDNCIVKQGRVVSGLFFLLRGQAKVTIDPTYHAIQYPLQVECGTPTISHEIFQRFPKPCQSTSVPPLGMMPPRFRCRKKRTQCEICVIAPSETIGDIEVSFGLKTFSQTVMCCSGDSEFYVLNYRNYEQLIAKRNSFTVDVIKRGAQEKLRARMNGSCGRKLRLFHTLLEREENPEPPPCNTKKKDPTLITPEIDFLPQLGAIIDIFGQGTVFYRNRMREMAKMRAKERATFRGDPGLGLRFPTGIPPHQQPRRPSSYDQNNDRVQKTFANQLDNEYDDVEGDEEGEDWHTAIACYSDFDSSDRAMRLLEDKIDAWHAAIETDKNNSIRIESKRTNSRPPSGAIKLKRVHLDHMKGLLPGRKVIVRPRQLSDAAKLLADERPPSELRASSSLRPASASMSRERRARSSLSSSHLSKEAPAALHPKRQLMRNN